MQEPIRSDALTVSMNNMKTILGILVTIAGGVVMVTCMVFAIIHVAGSLYEDVHSFDVVLPVSPESSATPLFSIKAGKLLSLWLKTPDRQIENKAFEINVSLLNENGDAQADFNEDFKFGFLRNSAGNGQFYRLGEYRFDDSFNGYFRYEVVGNWRPQYKTSLVLRETKSVAMPVKQIGGFVLGVFVLITGIGTIAKNRNQRRDEQHASKSDRLRQGIHP